MVAEHVVVCESVGIIGAGDSKSNNVKVVEKHRAMNLYYCLPVGTRVRLVFFGSWE